MTDMEKEVLINDVTLYIENNGDLYREMIIPICESLGRKKYNGTFDSEKALKAWYNVAVWGLKKYHKYIYDGPGHWYDILTTSERRQVADELQAFYADEVNFLTNRLIKEHERSFFVGVAVGSAYLRSDANGNGIYDVSIKCDNGKVFSGESQDTHCFHNWINSKKVKVFYHYTPKRKKLKFDEFQLL